MSLLSGISKIIVKMVHDRLYRFPKNNISRSSTRLCPWTSFELYFRNHSNEKVFSYEFATGFGSDMQVFLIDFNPLNPSVILPYPLKTSENVRFSDVFSGCRKTIPGCNGLTLTYL